MLRYICSHALAVAWKVNYAQLSGIKHLTATVWQSRRLNTGTFLAATQFKFHVKNFRKTSSMRNSSMFVVNLIKLTQT